MEEVQFSAVFRMLRQQKWAILSLMLATALACALFTLLVLKRQYLASSTILYSDASINSTAAGLIGSLGVSPSLLTSGPAGWFETILTSRRLARKMVRKYDLVKVLKADDELDAMNKLIDRIVIDAKPEAKSVRVQVQIPGTPKRTFTNPPDRDRAQMAANIANDLVGELDHWLNSTEYQSSARQRKYIESQLSKVLASIGDTRQQLLQAFRTSGVFAPEDQGQAWLQALALVETDIAQTQAQLTGAAVTRSALEQKDETRRLAGTAVTESTASAVLNQLRQQETELQVQLQRETEVNHKTDEHPDVAALRKALRETQAKIAQEVRISGETQKLQETRLSKQLGADQARWSKLSRQLKALPSQGLVVETLRKELESKADLVDMLTKQLILAMIQEEQQTENFTVLDVAEAPRKPASPSLPVAVVVGLFLGVLLGLMVGTVRHLRQEAAA